MLSFVITVMFFVVTYPNGFIIVGWTLFYTLWYLGAAVLIAGAIVFTLPYVGRLSMWESEHIRNEWLRRRLRIFAQDIERRVDRALHVFVRGALTLEFHVVNQYAKMHHSSELARQRMFLGHISLVAENIARRHGIAVAEKEVAWKR
ncbi:MAG: hypothetical protein Q8P88_01260 [Candidatus Jorgensenbacteria bacterium]|nr:hypothetical protein [Candidatus Jorgensenbacteria bacterium]